MRNNEQFLYSRSRYAQSIIVFDTECMRFSYRYITSFISVWLYNYEKPGYLFNNRKHYFKIYHFSIFMVIKLEPALYPTLITIKMEPLPNE